MLDVPSLVDGIIVGQVSQPSHVRMSDCAMIALVIVVGKGFPVEIAFHAPYVIKLVLGEIKRIESFLIVNTLEIIFPCHCRGGRRIQIDPDKSQGIDVHMHREQAVILLLKASDRVESGCLGQFAAEAIGPTVVFAGEYPGVAFVFRHHWESPVPADVVEAIQGSVFIETDHKRIPGLFETQEITGFCEPQFVGDQEPPLRKYGTPF